MKLMFNEDWIHFFLTRYEYNIDVTKQYLKDFIYQYKDTQITDFSLNVNGTVSSFPSKYLESFVDKYNAKQENGVEVEYKNTFAKTVYDIFVTKALDPYKVWIDTLREINIKPWISVRMNDCHMNFKETDLLKSSFVSERQDLWRISNRKDNGYFGKCFNFFKDEVRNRMLNYIEEVLERYNIDGLELDFTRELTCFPVGYEQQGIEVLNAFMRQVKELTLKFEQKLNHKLDICVLVASNPIVNLNAGLDIMQWAKEGLIDVVVGLPRWQTIDTDMPIGMWKRILGDKVRFAAGQQLLVQSHINCKPMISNVEMAFGQAAANLANGSDFVYLYNYMDLLEPLLKKNYHETCVRTPENLRKILNNIGDLKTILKMKRSHVLTYNDHCNYWDRVHSRLPITITPQSVASESIRIAVGEITKGAQVSLVLGIESEKPLKSEDFEVYINSEPVKMSNICGIDKNICDLPGYRFDVKNAEIIDKYLIAEIKAKKGCNVKYAEVVVTP